MSRKGHCPFTFDDEGEVCGRRRSAKWYENDVLAAVIVGGVSLRGGQGSILGAMFGALLIVILSNGMQLLGIAQVYGDQVKGLIIIAAIAADLYSSYRLNKPQGNFLKWLLSKRSPLPANKVLG